MKDSRTFILVVWLMVSLVSILALIAWGQHYLTGGRLTLYDVFPLLGILAFSIMWSHYVSGALQRYYGHSGKILGPYFKATSLLVLSLILLHPGLLILQLWIDGLGLPPGSYQTAYPDMSAQFAIMLGSVSLVAFLLFELHRKFSRASWWKYIERANVVAMFLIFYHALQLGGVVKLGWYLPIWITYGVLLAAAIAYTYYYDKRRQQHES